MFEKTYEVMDNMASIYGHYNRTMMSNPDVRADPYEFMGGESMEIGLGLGSPMLDLIRDNIKENYQEYM